MSPRLHVGIIPDGTRRWAQRTEVPLPDAYRHAIGLISAMVRELHTCGCTDVSVYCSSAANLGRPHDEIDAMSVACDCVPETLGELKRTGEIGSVQLVGDTASYAIMTSHLESLCQDPSPNGVRLNLLVGYDPWVELRALARFAVPITIEHLPVPISVDSIIRTAGTPLLSGFLPLQSASAQFVMSDKLFNDLSAEDIRSLASRACGVRHQLGV